MIPEENPHYSVMLQVVMNALQPRPGNTYVDGTLGAGGHTESILSASSPDGKVIAFEIDPQAIQIATERLKSFSDRLKIIHDSYSSLSSYLDKDKPVDGILLDLGVSSMQIDNPERGFSFQKEGPLDMRFNPDQSISAYQIINDYPEEELARILYIYGEERKSRQIAAKICSIRKNKPIQTTTELAAIIADAIKQPRQKIHPATKSFQAIRIAVNGELDAIEKVLPMAVSYLKPGGRLAVISFHSLEDRIIKHFFQSESRNCICPPNQPICTCKHTASIKIITQHPQIANTAEIETNIRSRSAKLRVAEKIGEIE